MAINNFLAAADVVAQVDTFTPANVEIGDIFLLTIFGYDGTIAVVSFTATAATVANVTAGLASAWAASVESLADGITAADGTTVITLTADVPGDEFKVSSTATNGGATDDQTFTRVATTKNEGPSDWSSPDNWSLGTVPGGSAGEDVYVSNTAVDLKYGLDQSGIANTIDNLNFEQSYSGKLGHNGETGLVGDYLQIKCTALYIGQNIYGGSAQGSGRIKVNTGNTQSAITIYNSGTSVDSNKPAIRLLTNHADTVIREIRKGDVGICVVEGETTLLDNIHSTYDSKPLTDTKLTIGRGVTMTSLKQTGGKLVMLCAATTIDARNGTLTIGGEGAITTLNCDGASVVPASTGTITNCNVTGGSCDFTRSAEPRQVTNFTVGPAGAFTLDPEVITLPNGIETPAAPGRLLFRISAA